MLLEPAGHAYPALQLVQAPAPASLNWPAGHTTTVALVDPAGHACPAAHTPVHSAVCAVAEPHFPGAQAVQDPAPGPLYRPAVHVLALALVDPAGHAYPALQLVQAPAPASLNWPAGHTTAVALVDPAGHACPAAHTPVHSAVCAVAEPHFPGAQAVQDPAPGPLYRPAVHVLALALVDPAGHAYPAVQALVHTLARATELLHVPAAQLAHAPAPERLYVPAGQMTTRSALEPSGHAYPAVQLLLHAAAVGRLFQVPAGQLVQTAAPTKLYVPTGHCCSYWDVAPAGQKKPAAQLPVHAELGEPREDEPYRPAPQVIHRVIRYAP